MTLNPIEIQKLSPEDQPNSCNAFHESGLTPAAYRLVVRHGRFQSSSFCFCMEHLLSLHAAIGTAIGMEAILGEHKDGGGK